MKNSFVKAGLLITFVVLIINSCNKEEVPKLTTIATINILGTSASTGGTITSEGSSTILSRGVCWSTGTTPTVADSKTSDGGGAGSFVSNITGLNGATVYYVRAYATNSVGTGYGMAMSFTTLGQAPSPTNPTATNVTTTSATLNGAVNPNYLSTVVTFEYGTTISYGSTAIPIQSPVTGNTATNISADITGLTAGTIYHYRIKAVNPLGTSYGIDVTFTTLGQVPTVTTISSTNVSTTSASISGSVNANYLSSVVTFEYGTTTNYGSTVTATQSPVSGNLVTNVSTNLTSLTAGTIYHYRVKAVNSLGTSYGSDMTFTTLGLVPTVISFDPIYQTSTSVILKGSVSANYLSTVVVFEYGTTTSYGNIASPSENPFSGNFLATIVVTLTNLTSDLTYHYRIKATNSLGTIYSNDMSFTITIANLLTTGLIASYPFSGNTTDESGNGFNGTVYGAVLTSDRFGNANSAYSFTDNQYILVSGSQNQNLYPISISLWYSVSSINFNGNIFNKYIPASWNGYQILAADDRNVSNSGVILNNGYAIDSWYVTNGTDKIIGYYNEPPFQQSNISFNTWYHYVFVADVTGGKIYVNGHLVSSHSWSGSSGACSNLFQWQIGGQYTNWFNGKIDDIRIYNRVLSQNEITYLSAH